MRLSLIHNSLSEVEKQIFSDELISNKFEPLIFFGELVIIPSTKDLVILDTESPNSNEIIHEAPHTEPVISSNHLLLTYGVKLVNLNFRIC